MVAIEKAVFAFRDLDIAFNNAGAEGQRNQSTRKINDIR